MRHRSMVLRYLGAACAIAMMLVLATSYAADRTTPKGRGVAEMPMHVQTEGMTYNDYRANQAALLGRLVGSVPASAMQPALRVEVSQTEIDAVERSPRISGTPLAIGLVKGVTPRFDLDGLRSEAGGEGSHRGTSGVATRTANGGYAWAMPVVSSRAGSLRLHIESMSLAPNAALYFYSRAGEAFGPYLNNGPNGDGDFWTDTVFGTEGILQIEISGPASAADLRRNVLAVTEAGIVTPRFAGQITPQAPSFCGDPSCLVDATCYNSPADPAKLAVAKMEWTQGAYIYTCTGGLISDNNPTQGNFFLTANHCVGSSHTARNVQFYWRFATSTCNGTCPTNNGWPYKTSGASVAATGKKGDFSLLQLSADPPSGSVFLGWTTAPVANSNGAALYRISNPDFGPQVFSQHSVDTAFSPCGGWPRGNWIYSRDVTGAIDGGSSGSPIVNSSSQIVGQLSGTCGASPSDPCASGPGEANTTVDGAFAADYVTIGPIINP